MTPEEQILVIPKSAFDARNPFTGFAPIGGVYAVSFATAWIGASLAAAGAAIVSRAAARTLIFPFLVALGLLGSGAALRVRFGFAGAAPPTSAGGSGQLSPSAGLTSSGYKAANMASVSSTCWRLFKSIVNFIFYRITFEVRR